MPKRVLVIGLCAVLVALGSHTANSQESQGTKVGISASVQTTQFDILVPIWTSDRFSIAPAFGFVWVEEGGTDFRFALVPRFFFRKDKVAPYLGLKAGVLIASPEIGESATDGIFGAAFGGEFFLDDHFSFGTEAQLNLTTSSEKSARFGNPGRKNLNTAAAIYATVYF